MVDDDDLVGQLVGLVEVLGGQQQRGAAGHQVPDDIPHAEATPGVEPGGGLIEEEDSRPADEAGSQVEAPLHAAGIALGRTVGRIDEVESLEELSGALPGLTFVQVVQAAHDLEVVPTGQFLLDRRRLAG